jgi:hypothetical protein
LTPGRPTVIDSSPLPHSNSVAIPKRAIYTVADSRFFVGLVALVNSLRVLGHREPIFVLDCGLTAEQLRLLEPEVQAYPAPPNGSPFLLKPILPLEHPAETVLLVDADVIVTASFDPLFELAEQTGGVAFADALDRFEPEWQALLGLPELRRETYFNSGILLAVRSLAEPMFTAMCETGKNADLARSMAMPGMSSSYPLYFLDQDIANAVAASVIPPGSLRILAHRLTPHPPFPGLVLVDPTRLDCAYSDGTRPFALHHIQSKPWLSDVPATVYSRLLPRLLLGEDVAIRLDPKTLPLRLRSGGLSGLARGHSSAVARLKRWKGSIGLRRRLSFLRETRSDGSEVSTE